MLALSSILLAALASPVLTSTGTAVQDAPAASVLREELRTVAGGPDDAVEVTYLRLAGTNFDIGRRLAEIGRERHGCGPARSLDPLRTAAQLAYFRRYLPQHAERMRGAAAAFGVDFDDSATNVSGLGFGFGKPGCTVAWYPPALMADGVSVVSRNFDFTTGTFDGRRPDAAAGEEAVCGRPYVMELCPEGGYSSIAVCSYDLLGGVVDGMNSEGLVIALLADDEAMGTFGLEGARGAQAGFGVIQVGRYVLETCATAAEARAALLEAKLYWRTIPCHYLVADAHGDAFVWENAPSLTHGYVWDAEPGRPLVTTNFMRYLHPDVDDPDTGELPEEEHPLGSFRRYRTVCERIAGAGGDLSRDFVKETCSSVANTMPAGSGPWAPGRTLWHALYVPAERTVAIDFYLGEDESGRIRRSGYRTFALGSTAGEPAETAAR